MTTPGFDGAQGFRNTGTVIATFVIIEGAKGGLFVYSPSPGLGNLVLSIAAMAGVDKYGNAYPAGETLFNTTFQVENAGQVTTKIDQFGNYLVFNSFGALLYILAPSGNGWFIYEDTGSATQGDLIATATSKSGTDQFGNAFLGPGITTYGAAGSGQSIQIAPKVGASNNPFLRLLSGRASEGGGGFITEDVFNIGLVNEYLSMFIGSPGTNGPDQSLALIQLASASLDGSTIAGGLLQVQLASSTIACAEWSAEGFVSTIALVGGIHPGTGTSDTNPAVAETWQSLGSPGLTNVASDHGRYRMTADGMVEFDCVLHCTGAAPSQASSYANALPAAYQPAFTHIMTLGYNGNVVAADRWPRVVITTTGAVNIALPALPVNTQLGATMRIPLD